jgi:site-specific DNA-methyltransferase (adenine-specific)
MPVKAAREYRTGNVNDTRADGGRTPDRQAANVHPCVKPLALMRWLVRLITPPSGIVLDPFMGSGTTGIAAALEGFPFIGIEKEAEYMEIARRRIAHHTEQGTLGDAA